MELTPHDVVRTAETGCLECGNTLNAIGTMDGTAPLPRPGDPVACIRCGAVMTIEGGVLRCLTEKEVGELVADTEMMDALAAMVRKIHFIRHGVN